MICVPVPSDDVERHWEHMLQFLRPAIERSNGRWSANDVLNEIESGRLQAWALIDGPLLYGVGVTEIHQYPGCRVLTCLWLGGVEAHKWLDVLDKTVSEWAIGEGCTRMEIVGRKGWERLGARLGFAPSYVFFEKELGRGTRQNDGAIEANILDSAPAGSGGSVEELT